MLPKRILPNGLRKLRQIDLCGLWLITRLTRNFPSQPCCFMPVLIFCILSDFDCIVFEKPPHNNCFRKSRLRARFRLPSYPCFLNTKCFDAVCIELNMHWASFRYIYQTIYSTCFDQPNRTKRYHSALFFHGEISECTLSYF